MTTYVATITHDDDGDLNVMIEGAGSSPDDLAVLDQVGCCTQHPGDAGAVVEKVTFN